MSTAHGKPRAREATARWILEGRQIDLIHVDGSHTLGDAMCDLLLADRLLRPGGWLIADDVANKDYPSVAEAWATLPDWYERRDGPPTWGVARKAALRDAANAKHCGH